MESERKPVLRDSAGVFRTGNEIHGRLEVPFVDAVVTQLRIDNAFSLAFDSSETHWWVLRLEGGFEIDLPDGRRQSFDEEAGAGQLGHAAEALLHRTVTAASVSEAGVLTIAFSDQTQLRVHPHCQWEARTLNGPEGQLIVCGPGGNLSVWGKNEKQKPSSV